MLLFCLRLIGSRAEAEDACQDIFVKALKGLSSWDGRASFKTWLYTIARNHGVDLRRKRRHRETESLDRTSDPNEVPPVERMPGPAGERPDRVEGRRALARAIEAGLARLSPEQREVFVLREQAGLSFRAIAEITEAPENTVKSRMRYALEHLRAHLAAAGWAPGDEP